MIKRIAMVFGLVLTINFSIAWGLLFPLTKLVESTNYADFMFTDNLFLDLRIMTILCLTIPLAAIYFCRHLAFRTAAAINLGIWAAVFPLALILSPSLLKKSLLNPLAFFGVMADPLVPNTELAPGFSMAKYRKLEPQVTEGEMVNALGKPLASYGINRRYSKPNADGDFWQVAVAVKNGHLEKQVQFYLD